MKYEQEKESQPCGLESIEIMNVPASIVLSVIIEYKCIV